MQPKFPYEPWRVTEHGFSARDLRENESVFALGNGFIGLRGNLEEGCATGAETIQGSFLNGVFDSEPIVYGEKAYGYAKTTRPSATSWTQRASSSPPMGSAWIWARPTSPITAVSWICAPGR